MALNFQEIKFVQFFLIKDKDVTGSPENYTANSNVLQEPSDMLPSRGMRVSSGSDDRNRAFISPSLQQIYKCLSCDKIFFDRGNPTEAPHHCSDCTKKFNVRHFLESQEDAIGSNKPCKCTTCGKAFRYMSSLNRHLVVHSGEKRYTCSVCNKSFTQQAHLKTHATMHTGEKPFQCPVCNMAFSRKGNLKRHLQVHKGVKFYECDACKPRPMHKN